MAISAGCQTIVRALLQISGADLEEVKLEATVEGGWSKKVYRRKAAEERSKGLRSPANVDSEVDDALEHLREAMAQSGQRPRSRCTFTLMPDGDFKLDVAYDD